MKTTLRKALTGVLMTFSILACKKSENIPPPEDAPVKLVKKVSSTPIDFTSYEYDAAGNVTKYVSQWQNGAGGVSKQNNVFEYNGSRLTKFSNEAGYANFVYKGNLIDKSEHFASNGKKLSTYQYEYDQTGKIVTVLELIANPLSDGASETKITYQYYGNGNVSKIDYYYKKGENDPFVLGLSKLFVEYDNKKNPEPNGIAGFFLPGQILQRNNPIKINNVLTNGTIEGYSRFEYTYNGDGYPVTRKHFIATGTTEQSPILFQYTY